jgi:cytochrome P450
MPLQALRDTTLGEVVAPSGMVVFGLLRRDSVSEAFVPRAAAFEPERWLVDVAPGQVAASVRRTSMPFGAGPRIFLFRYLALLEMKLAMAVLLGLECFELASVDTPDGAETREHLSFTMTPVGLVMDPLAKPSADTSPSDVVGA